MRFRCAIVAAAAVIYSDEAEAVKIKMQEPAAQQLS